MNKQNKNVVNDKNEWLKVALHNFNNSLPCFEHNPIHESGEDTEWNATADVDVLNVLASRYAKFLIHYVGTYSGKNIICSLANYNSREELYDNVLSKNNIIPYIAYTSYDWEGKMIHTLEYVEL